MAETRETSLVTPMWLQSRLPDPRVHIIDIRGTILPPTSPQPWYAAGRDKYDKGHIPGAQYVDWLQEIVDPNAPVKVTVMTEEAFVALMGRLGIGHDDTIVIYDDDGCHIAARMWWICRYYGHKDVRLLDGGWERWKAEGHESSQEVNAAPKQTRYETRMTPAWRANIERVRAASSDGAAQLIDCRSTAMYKGEVGRGQKLGHIPGAFNLPWQSLVEGPYQTFKPNEAIRKLLQDAGLDPTKPMITYCNGGVSSSVGLFALHLLGYSESEIANYDGSWYEWEADPTHAIETA